MLMAIFVMIIDYARLRVGLALLHILALTLGDDCKIPGSQDWPCIALVLHSCIALQDILALTRGGRWLCLTRASGFLPGLITAPLIPPPLHSHVHSKQCKLNTY